MEGFLTWTIPKEFMDKAQQRSRRQALSDDGNVPTGFEVLIATEDTVGQDYATTPSGVGTFSMTLSVSEH